MGGLLTVGRLKKAKEKGKKQCLSPVGHVEDKEVACRQLCTFG